MQKFLSRQLFNLSKSLIPYFYFVCKMTYDPPFFPIPKHPEPPKPKPKPPNPTSNRNPTSPIHPTLPFDFRNSYSRTNPSVEPNGFREPKRFSPFGPGRLDREWIETLAPVRDEVDSFRVEDERIRILGDPLTKGKVEELVEKYRHSGWDATWTAYSAF